MRKLSALLIAVLFVVPAAPALAAPPDDIPAYCNARHLNYSRFVLPCINGERAAKNRLERERQTFTGVDRATIDRCTAASASWQDAELCVRQPAAARPSQPSGGGGGLIDNLNRASNSMRNLTDRTREYNDATRDAIEATKAAREAGVPPVPVAPLGPPPNVIIFEPLKPPPPSAPSTAPEAPGRTITPAEAAAQSRAAEKTGKPGSKCQTKVYGGGAAVTARE